MIALEFVWKEVVDKGNLEFAGFGVLAILFAAYLPAALLVTVFRRPLRFVLRLRVVVEGGVDHDGKAHVTDMPTAAFLEASAARLKKKQKISTFALTFPKPQMFALGARPVIYGLSGPATGIPKGASGGRRIIPAGLLPKREQYRYVTYAPTSDRWAIDWTHEREWRWCMTDDVRLKKFEADIEEWGIVSEARNIPGLDLYAGKIKGIGVIVNTENEARMVFHDVLSLVDRKLITPDTFEYVLVASSIPAPEKVRDPDAEASAIAAATIDLSTYLGMRNDRVFRQVSAMIKQVNDKAPKSVPGEVGTCWLWFADNVHSVTRALFNAGHLIVNREGKYLLPVRAFSTRRDLAQREDMVKKLAKLVNAKYGVQVGYFSVLNSTDPDAIPTYNSDFLDDRQIYNFWSESL